MYTWFKYFDPPKPTLAEASRETNGDKPNHRQAGDIKLVVFALDVFMKRWRFPERTDPKTWTGSLSGRRSAFILTCLSVKT
jgi:hypothetical protein